MNMVGEALAKYLIINEEIDQEERDLYEYGFKLAVQKAVCISTCVLIMVLSNTCIEGILFGLVFIPLRAYAGGLHLKTFTGCYILSSIVFWGVMLWSKYVFCSSLLALSVITILVVCVYLLHPVECGNRTTDEQEDVYFSKRLASSIVLVWSGSVACYIFELNNLLMTMLGTLFMIVMTMCVAKRKWLSRK